MKISKTNTQLNFCQAKDNSQINKLHKTFVKLTKEQIKTARKMDNKDAAVFYYDLIADCMDIPQEIRPKLVIENKSYNIKRLCGCYDWGNNTLTYYSDSVKNKKFGKWWTFGLIRHELEHFRQTVDIMLNKDVFNMLCAYCTEYAQKNNIPHEKIEECMAYLVKLRSTMLKYYSETDKNSSNYKKTKQYFDSMINYKPASYKNLKQLFEYLIQKIEFDACKAQGLNWINYLKTLILYKN